MQGIGSQKKVKKNKASARFFSIKLVYIPLLGNAIPGQMETIWIIFWGQSLYFGHNLGYDHLSSVPVRRVSSMAVSPRFVTLYFRSLDPTTERNAGKGLFPIMKMMSDLTCYLSYMPLYIFRISR